MLVICNGMPRSGSTLQYNVVRCLVDRAGRGVGHGFNSVHAGHAANPGEHALYEWSRDADLHVLKMHEVIPSLEALLADGSAKVCYIYRDLRDAAASTKRALGHRGPALLSILTDAVKHYDILHALRGKHPGGILWQRYEDVYADLRAAIAETATFLDLPDDPETVDAVHDECSIAAADKIAATAREELERYVTTLRESDPYAAAVYLQDLRRTGGMETRIWRHPEWLLHYNHISRDKGAPGAWTRALTQSEAASIHERFGAWLIANDYHVPDPEAVDTGSQPA